MTAFVMAQEFDIDVNVVPEPIKANPKVKVTVESPVNPGDVVINELMWMGSTLSTADEWIELHNTTGLDIDLSNWDITRKSGGSEILMLTIPADKTISADGYFLISNYDADDPNSMLDVTPDLVATSVSLASTKLQIKLYDGALGNKHAH